MSKNDAWMPLYIGDYLADTMRLSTIEHGAYLLLLMEYWRQGPLPDDDAELADTCKMSVKDWMRIAKRIRSFFSPVDGRLRQKRIDAERAKADEISNKRRAAVAQRADRQPTKKDTNGPQGGNNGSTNVEHEYEEEFTNVSRLKTQSQSQSHLKKEKKERELRSLGDCDLDFAQWWTAYPRKEGKGKARPAYLKARRKASADQLLAAVEGCEWSSNPRFIPHPASWLNGERWLDEVDTFDPVLKAAGLSREDFDLSEFTPIGPPT